MTSSPSDAADVDVRRDLVDGRRVDERADVGRRVEAVAETQALRARLEPLEQPVDDRPLDDDPRGGRAALAGRAERAPQDPVGGEIEVGVGQDDDAVLAAELEREPLERSPARTAIDLPVSDDPVNEITPISGFSTIASPTSPPVPVTRLTTPAGTPASASSSTSSVAQWGVSLDGLKSTTLPVTSAGIIFQHGIAIGKFQGVMIPANPIG